MDYRHFASIIKYMTELSGCRDFETQALVRFRNLMDFDGGLLLRLNHDGIPFPLSSYNLNETIQNYYVNRGFSKDPLLPYSYRAEKPSLADQVMKLSVNEDIKGSSGSSFSDFIKETGYHHCLLFTINDNGDGFRLFRKRDKGSFTPDEIEMCKMISQPLGKLFETNGKIRETYNRMELFEKTKSSMYFGYLVFDESFRLISSNKPGIDRMQKITGKNLIGDVVNVFIGIVKGIIENSPCYQQENDYYDVVQSYIIEVVLNKQLDNAGRFSTNYIVFIYAREWFSALVKMNTEKVIAAYHLTDREKEILYLLLNGCTNSEVSEDLNISVYTVKDHIKSIYSKVAVTSKAELIIKIYTGSYY